MMLRRRGETAKLAGTTALLALVLVAPLLGNPYYTSLLIVIAIHTILTVGLCLLMGYAGQVSLGHAAFYGLGAFSSAILTATHGVNPWLAMVFAATLSGSVAFLMAFPIFRLRGNYLAMATLGFGVIVYILFTEMKQLTGGPSGLPGVPSLAIGPLELDTDSKFYYLAWAFCLGVLFVSQNIVNSRVGRALRAIHGSEAAALSLGVEVSRLKMKVFVLSAVYASLAGSLYAHYTGFVSPQPFGFMFSVRIVVMAVVGGLASVWGAVFGAAAITLLSDLLGNFGSMDTVAFGLILILVMVFMPQGLFRWILDAYARGEGSGVRGLVRGVREGMRERVREWARAAKGREGDAEIRGRGDTEIGERPDSYPLDTGRAGGLSPAAPGTALTPTLSQRERERLGISQREREIGGTSQRERGTGDGRGRPRSRMDDRGRAAETAALPGTGSRDGRAPSTVPSHPPSPIPRSPSPDPRPPSPDPGGDTP